MSSNLIFIYLGHTLAFSHIPHNTEGYILEFSVLNCPELADITKVTFIGLRPLKASVGVCARSHSSDKLRAERDCGTTHSLMLGSCYSVFCKGSL